MLHESFWLLKAERPVSIGAQDVTSCKHAHQFLSKCNCAFGHPCTAFCALEMITDNPVSGLVEWNCIEHKPNALGRDRKSVV